MARGGKRQGAGRPPGTPNKRTVERLESRGDGRPLGTPNKKTIERAAAAEQRVAEARATGQKLAIDVLRDFMNLFYNLAAHYRHTPSPLQEQNVNDNPAEFLRYAELSRDTAHMLAAFETPKLRAIMVGAAPGASVGALPPPTLDLIANENDPAKLYRYYQMMIAPQRRSPRATR